MNKTQYKKKSALTLVTFGTISSFFLSGANILIILMLIWAYMKSKGEIPADL